MSEQANERPVLRRPKVWGNVPPRNPNFTGRASLLEQLRSRMGAPEPTAVIAEAPTPHALHGLGGVGKTQLVTQYAWVYGHEYDVVWWIVADQAHLVPAALADLAPELGLQKASLVGIDEAVVSVRRALQQGSPYGRWLLIFDNADDPESVRQFFPDGGPGHVLITSRNTRWSAATHSVPVDVFTREESVEFLQKRLRRGITADEAFRLSDALGDLPLALEQAASFKAETGMSTDEYIDALTAQARRTLNVGQSTDYPQSLTAAWQLSVQAIESRMPSAATLLRCLAFFGPDPIPRDLFRLGNSAGIAGELGEILKDPLMLSSAFGELNRFALARIDNEAGTVQVHRLIQALLRDALGKELQEQFRHDVHLLLAASSPEDPENTTMWRRFGELVSHIGPCRLRTCPAPGPRSLSIKLVRFLYRRGDYQAAKLLAETLSDEWTRASDENDLDVLRVNRHRATVLWYLGEFAESRRISEETHRLLSAKFGPANDETLRVAAIYGANLRAKGDFKAALDLDSASMTASEENFGARDPLTLRAINNLALDYALLSDFRRSQDLHKLAYLEQSSARKGVGTADVLVAWNGLARVVRLSGDYEQAIELGKEAYEFGRRELSAEHPLTLVTAKELSIAERSNGDLEAAHIRAEETHGRLLRLLGADNPDTMAAAVAVSNCLRESGHFDEALRWIKDVQPRYIRVFGEEHPFVYGCRTNMALALRLRGDVSAARKLDTSVRTSLLTRLGAFHEYTFASTMNLASDCAAQTDWDEARRLGDDTLRSLTATYGPEHYLTLSAAINLSMDLRSLGSTQEAEDLWKRTMELYEKTLRSSHAEARRANSGERFSWDFDPVVL
ncbi:FxSxx-COOH system tetratricopeptide repeat protein [Nonomuraea sp. NPDC050663]|uniref:FxSxx-COOH system tetratricopeptide repeat protein n=1 Tax=Nonomuraea sp. NPDC050663 TaxID=3364370 RepID=UPI00378F0A5C